MQILHSVQQVVESHDLLRDDLDLHDILARVSVTAITIVHSNGRVETFDKGMKVKVQRDDD